MCLGHLGLRSRVVAFGVTFLLVFEGFGCQADRASSSEIWDSQSNIYGVAGLTWFSIAVEGSRFGSSRLDTTPSC